MSISFIFALILAFSALIAPIYMYEKLVNATNPRKSIYTFTFGLFVAFTVGIASLVWLLDYSADVSFLIVLPSLLYFCLFVPIGNIFLFYKIKTQTKENLYAKVAYPYLFASIVVPVGLFVGFMNNLFIFIEDGMGFIEALVLGFFVYVALATSVGLLVIATINHFAKKHTTKT